MARASRCRGNCFANCQKTTCWLAREQLCSAAGVQVVWTVWRRVVGSQVNGVCALLGS
jgi:hypothetical protein